MAISIFEVFDILFLIVLLGSLIWFLKKNKKNLVKEGGLYLYKTSWGIKLIEKIGGKYKRTLSFLSYVSIATGYVLMVGILYLLGNTTFQYLTNPLIVETIRAPPIAPVIPYFPQLFGLSEFFPPLYAVYFIISILIVATIHEFSHGVFAKRWGIKIKTTGFAFLSFFPVFFGAFVEQDDNQMTKTSKFKQMSILSAGVFANIITGLIFFILLILFFQFAFSPSGVVFDSYAYEEGISLSNISLVNGLAFSSSNYSELVALSNEEGFNKIEANNINYLITQESLQRQHRFVGQQSVSLYYDSPAINSNLERAIFEINGISVSNLQDLQNELSKHSPGETITLNVLGEDGQNFDREITLGGSPLDSEDAWLGVAFSNRENGFIKSQLVHFLNSFRPDNLGFIDNTYHEPLLGNFSVFIYYLLWWIVLINFLVALFNMLPVSILDGGRFFYLTLLGITKSEKISKFIYGIMGYFILMIFILLMLRWVVSFI